LTAVLALFFGSLLAVAPLAQLIRTRALRSSREVSLGWVAMVCLGASAWTAYGLEQSDPVIWVPNLLGAVVATATLAVVLRFR